MVCETVVKYFNLLIAQLSYIWACVSRREKLILNIHTLQKIFLYCLHDRTVNKYGVYWET